MIVRDVLKQNLGKWCKVVTTDGFILAKGYVSETWTAEAKPYLDDEVLKVEKGRSVALFRAEIVITIK